MSPAMPPSGDHVGAKVKHLRVLLPFSRGSLRIPDALAAEIDAGEALVVAPSVGKVNFHRVEVGRDGDGAFLGRGWPEFAAACGVGAGWLLVLRHRGRGVLTVKAFDASCCLRELGAPAPPSVEATVVNKEALHRLQFISVLRKDSMKKMSIPATVVQHYMPKEQLSNNSTAIFLGPLGKVWHIELEMNQSDVFFVGRWSQFLAFHSITEANALLLRYKGNMVFKIKVFESDGCQRESKHRDIQIQQPLRDIEEQQRAPSASIQKRKIKDSWPGEKRKKPKCFMISSNKASSHRKTVYEIGPPSWIRKHVNTNTLQNQLETCTIRLKTSMNSIGSWLVHGRPYENNSYKFARGWRRFCKDNCLGEGDICTFHVVKTTLWHVVITRYHEKINHLSNLESPFLSSRKYKSKNDWRSSEGQKMRKGSMTLNKASLQKKCVFEIGPPSWIKKMTNTNTLENTLMKGRR